MIFLLLVKQEEEEKETSQKDVKIKRKLLLTAKRRKTFFWFRIMEEFLFFKVNYLSVFFQDYFVNKFCESIDSESFKIILLLKNQLRCHGTSEK
jgi:hypothetical protein